MEDKLVLVYSRFEESEAPRFCQCLKPTSPSTAHPDSKLPSGPAKGARPNAFYTRSICHSQGVFLPPFYRSGAMRLRVRQENAWSALMLGSLSGLP